VDPAQSFSRKGWTPMGSALFKHRLLRQLGLQVYPIPENVFRAMAEKDREVELQKLFRKHSL
jgi:hypothetical protein